MLTKQKILNLKATAKAEALFTCILFTHSQRRTARHLANNKTLIPRFTKLRSYCDLSPQASFTKLGLCPQRMGLPPRAEVGKKQAFSFSLPHAHSPPMLLRDFTAVNVCTITASMPLPNVCLLSSSRLPGKDPTGFGW